MKVTWPYDKKVYSKEGIAPLPMLEEGEYQVRIDKVDYQTAKNSGKEMWVIRLSLVNDSRYKFSYYLVENKDNPDMTNQNYGRLFDCFDIPEDEQGDTDYWEKDRAGNSRWGGAFIEHNTYTNKDGEVKTNAKISWFLPRERQEELGWVLSLSDELKEPEKQEEEVKIPF